MSFLKTTLAALALVVGLVALPASDFAATKTAKTPAKTSKVTHTKAASKTKKSATAKKTSKTVKTSKSSKAGSSKKTAGKSSSKVAKSAAGTRHHPA